MAVPESLNQTFSPEGEIGDPALHPDQIGLLTPEMVASGAFNYSIQIDPRGSKGLSKSELAELRAPLSTSGSPISDSELMFQDQLHTIQTFYAHQRLGGHRIPTLRGHQSGHKTAMTRTHFERPEPYNVTALEFKRPGQRANVARCIIQLSERRQTVLERHVFNAGFESTPTPWTTADYSEFYLFAAQVARFMPNLRKVEKIRPVEKTAE